ncbi:hypothetical protein BX616_003352 [Lobosporangium transversale]|nr:hypothetical protein BX616_003352 [Lobosporangium transversale]
MTLTPDGRAIILGGINSQGILTNLTQAYVLDTQADATTAEWKVVPLFGQPPAPRMEFTAVMVNATTMLVYGGTSDFKSANWATFYLDLPTWTWTSPMAQGITPRRWGHTATMAGNVMVVAFGLSSRQSPGNTTVVLLDTRTNTWITQFDPQVMNIGTGNSGNDDSDNNDDDSGVQDVDGEGKGPMSVGMVLGLGFVVTLAIVGGVFWLLVRKRKRRTRNQRAKENIDQFTTSRSVAGAISSSSANHRNGAKGFFEAFSLGTISNNQSRTERDGRGRKRRDSKRYSTTSVRTQHPQSILERMAELGYSPLQFGYPESVIRQGSGGVTVSNYIYPNQPCTQIEKVVTCGGNDGDRNRNEVETQVVFHDLSSAQKEALRLEFEQRQRQGGHDQAPKHELLQSNVEEYV